MRLSSRSWIVVLLYLHSASVDPRCGRGGTNIHYEVQAVETEATYKTRFDDS
jgi:hypothetical protein